MCRGVLVLLGLLDVDVSTGLDQELENRLEVAEHCGVDGCGAIL